VFLCGGHGELVFGLDRDLLFGVGAVVRTIRREPFRRVVVALSFVLAAIDSQQYVRVVRVVEPPSRCRTRAGWFW
jgi:hypothetical protein